jgi:branched-chain amino acid transport system permease protein
VTLIGQHVVDALTLGSLYALVGIGIALIFGIMRLVNFAHGELIMVGGYALIVVGHPPWPLLIVVTLAASAVLALGMERVAFRPVRGASEATLLVTSFAVSYLLQNLALLIFGATPRTTSIFPSLSHSVTIAGLIVPKLSIVTIIATFALLGSLTFFLHRTELGLQMRAAAEDFRMARVLGVRANRVVAMAFGISGLLTGVAALLLVAQTGTVTPTMGTGVLLVAFLATILGGLGSLTGAVLGGFLLGSISVIFEAYLPAGLRNYGDAFTYAAVVVILIYRPQGLIVPPGARSRV